MQIYLKPLALSIVLPSDVFILGNYCSLHLKVYWPIIDICGQQNPTIFGRENLDYVTGVILIPNIPT